MIFIVISVMWLKYFKPGFVLVWMLSLYILYHTFKINNNSYFYTAQEEKGRRERNNEIERGERGTEREREREPKLKIK